MDLIKKSFGAMLLLIFPIMVFAQDQISDLQFLENLLHFVGGLKGAGLMVIVAGVVQLVMQALKTPFISKLIPGLNGKAKLLIVSGLSVVGGLLALMSEGHSFLASLMHSTTLAALQVFANQLIQQFSKKKEA